MPSDMDPQEAAAWASDPSGGMGQEQSVPTDTFGGEDSSSSVGSLYDGLWSTSPDVKLRDVDNPWNPEQGGVRRIYRGLMKMGDIDGMPAIVDIVIGVAEFASSGEFEVPSRSGGGDSSSSADDGGDEHFASVDEIPDSELNRGA